MAELGGKRMQAKRDLRYETRCAADALAALPLLAGSGSEENDGEWLVPSPDAALELLLQLQSLGESARVSWPPSRKPAIPLCEAPLVTSSRALPACRSRAGTPGTRSGPTPGCRPGTGGSAWG